MLGIVICNETARTKCSDSSSDYINTRLERDFLFESVFHLLCFVKSANLQSSWLGVASIAHYVSNHPDCEISMLVMLMRSYSYVDIMPVLKGIPDLPDLPNQPTS